MLKKADQDNVRKIIEVEEQKRIFSFSLQSNLVYFLHFFFWPTEVYYEREVTFCGFIVCKDTLWRNELLYRFRAFYVTVVF
jgi:hypothetical protein